MLLIWTAIEFTRVPRRVLILANFSSSLNFLPVNQYLYIIAIYIIVKIAKMRTLKTPVK